MYCAIQTYLHTYLQVHMIGMWGQLQSCQNTCLHRGQVVIAPLQCKLRLYYCIPFMLLQYVVIFTPAASFLALESTVLSQGGRGVGGGGGWQEAFSQGQNASYS